MHSLEDNQDIFKSEIADSVIYCDATSVGMHPQEDLSLINDPSYFRDDLVVFDVCYAPRETVLMKNAKAAGVERVYNGLGMMLGQGAEAFKLWTGEDMPVDYIRELLFSED